MRTQFTVEGAQIVFQLRVQCEWWQAVAKYMAQDHEKKTHEHQNENHSPLAVLSANVIGVAAMFGNSKTKMYIQMRGTVDPHSIRTWTTNKEQTTWKTRSLFSIDKHTNTERKIFATILKASFL